MMDCFRIWVNIFKQLGYCQTRYQISKILTPCIHRHVYQNSCKDLNDYPTTLLSSFSTHKSTYIYINVIFSPTFPVFIKHLMALSCRSAPTVRFLNQLRISSTSVILSFWYVSWKYNRYQSWALLHTLCSFTFIDTRPIYKLVVLKHAHFYSQF